MMNWLKFIALCKLQYDNWDNQAKNSLFYRFKLSGLVELT